MTTTRRRPAVLGGPEIGRVLAVIALFVLSLVGSAAVALPFLFQSSAVRAKIEQTVASAIKDETNLDVSLRIDRALWPPGVVVRDIRVASTTPGKPFASIAEARVTLRPFALLSGRVVVDAIEVVSPDIDAELVDGAPINLPLKLKEHPPKPKTAPQIEPPFRVIAITNAKVKVSNKSTLPGPFDLGQPISAELAGMDLDVDVAGEGTPVYEVRLNKASGMLHTRHVQKSRWPLPGRFVHDLEKIPYHPFIMEDDDVLCGLSLSARLTDATTARIVELKRIEVDVRLDDNPLKGNVLSCAAGKVPDDRIVNLRIDGLELDLPKRPDDAPSTAKLPSPKLAFDVGTGRVRVRVPAFLAYRYIEFDPLDGWLSLDVAAYAAIDLNDPLPGLLRSSIQGRIDGHELRLSHFRFGSSLGGDIALKPPLVVTSQKLEILYGGGHVVLTDVEARLAPIPFAKKKMPIKATLAITDLPLPGLVRELGVSEHPHVRWDFREAFTKISGHLDPLALDGDLKVKSSNFELAPDPIEKPGHGHIIGLSPKTGGNADLTAHLAVRPDHLGFEQVHVVFGGSIADGRVHLGFDDRLEVDAKSEQYDLADGSPLAKFPVAGVGKFDMKLRGTFDSFKGEGTAAFNGFVFDQFALGDIEAASFHFNDNALIEADSIKVKHGESHYDIPSMRIDLSGHGVVLDALAKSANLSLDDAYEIFRLTGDPRWQDIKGHVSLDARAHFVVGGKTDPCGGGRLDLDVNAGILALDLWGERYDGGSADVSLTWWDFDGGGLGMDLELHAASLKKKGGGSVVASGTIKRGGNLNLKVTAAGVQLRGLSTMPTLAIPIDGSVDAVAEVGGTFDTMRIVADVNVSPVRISNQTLPKSRFRLVREPLSVVEASPQPDAKGCYKAQKPVLFDPVKWAEDQATGEFALTGEAFGSAVKFDNLRFTDARKKVAWGKLTIRELDLAPLSLLRVETAEEELALEESGKAASISAVTGKASADVSLESLPFDAWWNAVGKVEHITIAASRGDLGIATVDPTPTITFGKHGLSLPETGLALRFGDVPTKVVVAAEVKRDPTDSKSPELVASIELPTIPLARLEEFMPKSIDRAEGTARGRLKIGGTLASPTWDGEVAIKDGAFSFKAISMPLVGVNGSIKIDPKRGVTIEKLTGELGGGTLELTGGAGIKGTRLGDVDVKIKCRDVHFRYGEGMSTTFDADLRATWTEPAPGAPAEKASVEGVVEIESFLYEKQVRFFDVGAVQAAKRTEVEAYDPLRDVMAFDIEMRSKRGFRVRNNLVDASLGIGPSGLRVVGTNQRWGVLGELLVVQGGTFRFRRHAFEIREGALRFDDETKIDPYIDVTAVTEFRRAATAGAINEWRIRLHAFGTRDEFKLELSSEPPLSQEDLFYLLTIGMTKAETSQISGNVAGGAGLDLLANVTGMNETLSQAIPVIDDFRFGTAYSLRTGRTEPQVTFGKKLTETLRASVTSGLGERREVTAVIEWRLSRPVSLQASYDNVNDVSSRSIGNVGVDLRYRLEF